jgi:aminoglycoside phosphotransferase (APT) family kinase protein
MQGFMSDVIAADLVINQSLATYLVAQLCGIEVKKSIMLGEGFDNMVFLFNDRWIFRFPRRHIAIKLIELELHILPVLAPDLPLRIPVPKFIGKPSKAYNASFYGHEIIGGETGCNVRLSKQEFNRLARDLADFLKVLHNLPLDTLDKNLLGPLFDRLDHKQMLNWLLERHEQIKNIFNLRIDDSKINTIISNSYNYISPRENLVLIHGDLYHRHLLFDNNKITGVIDWGDSCLSDRVVDFMIAFQFLPVYAREEFFAVYGKASKEELDYARFLGLYYIITLLWFGNDRKDNNLIRSSLISLAHI